MQAFEYKHLCTNTYIYKSIVLFKRPVAYITNMYEHIQIEMLLNKSLY